MSATDTDALTPDAIEGPAGGTSPFGALFKGLGLPDPAELVEQLLPPVDPDAPTLADVLMRLDDIAEALAPVVELANVCKANAGKLRKFGIVWT